MMFKDLVVAFAAWFTGLAVVLAVGAGVAIPCLWLGQLAYNHGPAETFTFCEPATFLEFTCLVVTVVGFTALIAVAFAPSRGGDNS